MLKKWVFMYAAMFVFLFCMGSGNVTVLAQELEDEEEDVVPEDIIITLDGNGGFLSIYPSDEPQNAYVTMMTSGQYLDDALYNVTVLEREDAKFLGWSDSPDGDTFVFEDEVILQESQTFYAIWKNLEIYPTMSLNTPTFFSTEDGSDFVFCFTAPDDGTYFIIPSEPLDLEHDVSVTDDRGHSLASPPEYSETYPGFEFEKDRKYTIRIFSETACSFCVMVTDEEYTGLYPMAEITALTDQPDGIRLSWKPVEGFSKYIVFREELYVTDWEAVATVDNCKYKDTGVETGKRYIYAVACMDDEGKYAFAKILFGYDHEALHLPIPKMKTPKVTQSGTLLKWTDCAASVEFSLYYEVYRRPAGGKWKCIATTFENSWYDYDELTDGKVYQYKVRCLEGWDKISYGSFSKEVQSKYHCPPKLKTPQNVTKGVKVQWKAVKGIKKYRVFRSVNGEWKKLGDSDKTYFLDTRVKSGENYSYTVCCLSSNGKKYLSRRDANGVGTIFYAAPAFTETTMVANGFALQWTAVPGVSKYQIEYKEPGDKWYPVGSTSETKGNIVLDDSNIDFYLRVRCLSSEGKVISGGVPTSKLHFVAAPEITEVKRVSGGVRLKWKVSAGGNKKLYRIYRATSGGKWKKLADTKSKKYLDKTAKKNVLYTYSIRCLSKDGKKSVSAYDAYGWGTLVPVKSLDNYKVFRQWMTDDELKQAYNAAAKFVQRYVKLKKIDKMYSIYTLLRQMVDSGEVSYTMTEKHYNDPYGYLIAKVASCAGSTRTTGLCLNMLGIPYEHVNENQNRHQWNRVKLGKNYWILDVFGLCFEQEVIPYMHNNPMVF